MPTIEIVSIGANKINLEQKEFDTTLRIENKIIPHRSFYEYFLQKSGLIIHLGNPEFKMETDVGYFASELIDWDTIEEVAGVYIKFKFLPRFQKEVNRIIEKAFEASPIKKSM